jgi:hypothetical protein
VACGHRLIFGCAHNTGSSTVAALACSPALPTLTSQVTIYGWSTNHPETGEPGFFLLSGRWVFSLDAQNNESFHFVGRVRDLCVELAA